MSLQGRKVVIVGGGVAGLSAAVYALKCGYQVELLEMHDMAGGLAMSWRRGLYTFETCLHWLVGSKPNGEMNRLWRELCDFEKLIFVNPEVFVRIETEAGDGLTLYTDVDRLEAELLRRSPQDLAAIRGLTHAIRALGRFHILEPGGGLIENGLNLLRDLPVFPLLGKLSRISSEEYGRHFADPLLRRFFSTGDVGKLPAMAMVLSLAWMNAGNAGYCIGGSQALIRLIQEKVERIGGVIRFKSRVEKILVENDTAVGVRLADGDEVRGDWVVSAADGHATIFRMLEGRYADEDTHRLYAEKETFASYLQVSLGVARDLSDQPPMLSLILDSPVQVDPDTALEHLGYRFFHFDPTFAPAGKTAVTCLLPTRNVGYWTDLREVDPAGYRAAKERVAQAAIAALDKRIPGIRAAIETVDVSTPASIVRYTGNWKGSQEGWLMEPGAKYRPLPNTLPGLKQFLMVGQWVMPGGGLPSGPLTARPAVKAMCRHDHVAFDVHAEPAEQREPVGV